MAEPKFTPWQNMVIAVKAINAKGKAVDYEFKRIMIDYANAVMDIGSEKEACELVGCNEYDVKNWISGYEGYKEYLISRSAARTFSNGIDKDWCYGLLGRAALGQIELSTAQIAAIKLIMQGEALISTAGNGKQKVNTGCTTIESI